MSRPASPITVLFVLLLTIQTGCTAPKDPVTTPTGLRYTVVARGSGVAARAGQFVHVHEATSLADGRVHYSTRGPGGRPVRFLLGGGQVIDGLDQGVTGMRVGERRRLVVPPALSRRSTYPPGLSPDDTLFYDVELVKIESGN